jgi:hypothetical protein
MFRQYWNVLIKIHYFLEHLLFISQRYYKMLGPTINMLIEVLIGGVKSEF